MLPLLMVLVARIVLAWLAGQSVGFLIVSWWIKDAYAWSWRTLPRRSRAGRVLLWICVWPVLLAWVCSSVRCSVCTPRPSAIFAAVSACAAIAAMILAVLFSAQMPTLDCLAQRAARAWLAGATVGSGKGA